jgi:transcriptional regulator with XRE-family HTH domain
MLTSAVCGDIGRHFQPFEEIARAAGVSRATVSRIERGDRRGGALAL